MVKLPDPTALGAGPNLRAGGTAQVDARVLRHGTSDLLEGATSVARAYNRGGDAISRSMGVAGEAMARAAGAEIQAGRAVSSAGEALGEAVTRSGARIGAAVTAGGARMADALERGGTAISASIRRSGDYWADATEKAGASQARAMQTLGRGLGDLASAAIEYQLASDQLAFTQAKSQWQIERANLEQKYERDQDYGTMPGRFEQELSGIRTTLGDSLENPAMRRKFFTETGLGATESVNRAKDRAFKVEADVNVAQLRTTLEGLQAAAKHEPDDKARGEKLIDGRRYIDAAEKKGYLDPKEAQKARTDWGQSYSVAWVESLPADARLELLRERPTGREATIDRIIGVESGGRATARNARSSAYGSGQFIDSTWLSTVQAHRPDLLEGRSKAEVLALRADPKLSREMVGHLYDDNLKYFEDNRIVPTPTNLYMAHFLGAETAARVLKAPGDTPISKVVSSKAVEANPEILGGGTVDQLVTKLDRKMGATRGTGTPIDFIPEPKRKQLEHQAQTEVVNRQAAAVETTVEKFKYAINEMEHGRIPAFGRDEILQSGLPLKDINGLIEKHDAAVKKQEDFLHVQTLVANSLPVNGFDPKQRAGVDLLYKRMLPPNATPEQAARTALDITRGTQGVMPETAITALKADMLSTDPKRVAIASELATRAMDINEHVFVRNKDIEQVVTAYQYYRDDLRYSPEQAAQLVIQKNSPEFKKELDIRRRDENLKSQIAKATSAQDLRNQLGENTWFGPTVGSDDATREALLRDYRSLVNEHYYTHAKDIEEAKKHAAKQLKDGGWGVTRVNGSSTIARFAPESAPVYRGIDNLSDRIAKQAVGYVKGISGEDVDRSKIRLDPIPRMTMQDWEANASPRYQLMYQDKNGLWQASVRPFSVDADIMRQDISNERREAFERDRAAAGSLYSSSTIRPPL